MTLVERIFMHVSVRALVRVVSSQPEHYSFWGGEGRGNSFDCLFDRSSGDVNMGNSENNLILLIDSSLNDFIVNA